MANKAKKKRQAVERASAAQTRARLLAQQRFLDAYSRLGNVMAACRVAGIARPTPYLWENESAEFAAAWAVAEEAAKDALEQEAYRRSVVGVDKPYLYDGRVATQPELDPQGQPTGRQVPITVKEYSDQLLALLLKGARPRKFRERVDVTGPDGQPLPPPAPSYHQHLHVGGPVPTGAGERVGASSDVIVIEVVDGQELTA